MIVSPVRKLLRLPLVALALLAGNALAYQTTVGTPHDPQQMTDRIIVKLRSAWRGQTLRGETVKAMATDRTAALSVTAGLPLRAVRPMSGDAHVVALPRAMRNESVQAVVDRLRADPTVESAYIDAREYLAAVPNDLLFPQQTYLQVPGSAPLVPAVNASGAWDITKGTSNVVIALIDGGVRFDHPDLAGRLLPGYDFVSADCTVGESGCTATNAFTTANDGNGRDADASDPGDWVTAAEKAANPFVSNCDAADSSWHGTHVAGIVGAEGNNATGITGLNWNATMLPVRVSGKCGAYRSDVIDGMRWAAGIAVPNVPTNTRPAKVINISLGSAGDCANSAYGSAVADVLGTGAVVVAAAGNEDAGVILPASCPGVVSVGAVRGDGTRTVYSNTGAGLTIMAPGGDYTSATNDRLASTNNAGRTTPVAYATAGYYVSAAGTSYSAPIVSGVVSLMWSAAPSLTSTQIVDALRGTARPFASVAGYQQCVAGGTNNASNGTPCNCTTAACGAGYVDASAAVSRAYALAGGSPTPPVVTPPVVTPPVVTPVVTAPPATSNNGGGGGGGAMDPMALLVLALVALMTRRLRARPDA